MQIVVDRRDPEPVYRQIAGQLREAIGRGHLRPGEALPSVRQLASELSVNPNTVARAYRQLEGEGFLAVASRSGVRVAGRGGARRSEARARRPGLVRELREVLWKLHQSGLSRGEIETRVSREIDRLAQREV